MTRDDEIITELYETLDHMRPEDRRYRAVDHVVSARRALRKQDPSAASRLYMEAARELKTSSNQEAHRAVEALERHAYLILQGA
jgi:hypothetical protein